MSKHYIPDGQGGFRLDTGPSGIEVLGMFILAIGGALMLPWLVGTLTAQFIFLIIASVFPSITVVGAIFVHILIAITYFLFSIIIYLVFLQKRGYLGKIVGGLLLLSVVLSPISSLTWIYGGEVNGVSTPSVVITQVQENFKAINGDHETPAVGISYVFCYFNQGYYGECSPESNGIRWTRYSIKNISKQTLNIRLDYFYSSGASCAADGDQDRYLLVPNEEKYFFCVNERNRSSGIEKIPQCIAISTSVNDYDVPNNYKKICSDNSWK